MYSTRKVNEDVNFFNAIKICLTQKYAKFNGRASRSEYWYFTLFSFIVMVLSSGKDALLGLAWLVLFIPMLAVSVRRLHGHWEEWLVLSHSFNSVFGMVCPLILDV